MKFDPLIKGVLIKRYKRFFVDIQTQDGIIVAHCPNTGSMRGLLVEGANVWVTPNDDPKRKLKFTWELIEIDGHMVCIQTNRANHIVKEGIENNVIDELTGYSTLKTEQKYGSEKSRIDILLQDEHKPSAYVEVKNVSLLEDGCGYFPDAVTTRGQKHLRELVEMVELGHRGVLLFHVAHTGIKEVKGADFIDPEYCRLLWQAHQKGVEILAYASDISPTSIKLTRKVPVILTALD